jgi:hypothetical protein
MPRQCCQCTWFLVDIAHLESCVGWCKSPMIGTNDLISGYRPNDRECPGFEEGTH